MLAMFGLLLGACNRPPKSPAVSEAPEFTRHFEDFVREGSILLASTDQGVSFSSFAAQLARTTGTFEAIGNTWPVNREPQRLHFSKAVRAWGAAYKVWEYKVSGLTILGDDLVYEGRELRLLREVRTDLEMPSDLPPRGDPTSRLTTLLQISLKQASEAFRAGREVVTASPTMK